MTNETEDELYEMAEQAWNDLWPEEPRKCVSKWAQRTLDRDWLVEVAKNIIYQYDGPMSDIGYHLGEFSTQFIEKRSEAILRDAKQDEAEARIHAYECSRDDWEGR